MCVCVGRGQREKDRDIERREYKEKRVWWVENWVGPEKNWRRQKHNQNIFYKKRCK